MPFMPTASVSSATDFMYSVPVVSLALTLYRSVAESENVEIRLHQTVLYNSIYRADDQLLINQHAYGIPAAHTPVFFLRDTGDGEMTALYLDSFERVWVAAAPLA